MLQQGTQTGAGRLSPHGILLSSPHFNHWVWDEVLLYSWKPFVECMLNSSISSRANFYGFICTFKTHCAWTLHGTFVPHPSVYPIPPSIKLTVALGHGWRRSGTRAAQRCHWACNVLVVAYSCCLKYALGSDFLILILFFYLMTLSVTYAV